jgi:succinate-semialdehyde dehydrogenase/glutarate-semialdehyde dehydrogenase
MYINGEWADAANGRVFDVTNPANGEVIGQVPAGGAADADRAIAAADAAFADWSATTAYERADLLMAAWRNMTDRADALAALMTTEQGKPLKAARAEVTYGADFLRRFAEEARRVTGSGCRRLAAINASCR